MFAVGSRAWYFYGASSSEQREKMAPYLLQWGAMRWARSRGCTAYDMWGVPDFDDRAGEGFCLEGRRSVGCLQIQTGDSRGARGPNGRRVAASVRAGGLQGDDVAAPTASRGGHVIRSAAVHSAKEWNAAIELLPQTSFLQSWEWGEFKRRTGWHAERWLWTDDERPSRPLAAAQVLERSLRVGPLALTVRYVPKGPLLGAADNAVVEQVLTALEAHARARRAIQLKTRPGYPGRLPRGRRGQRHTPR